MTTPTSQLWRRCLETHEFLAAHSLREGVPYIAKKVHGHWIRLNLDGTRDESFNRDKRNGDII